MNILIAQASPSEATELLEYFQGNACEVHFASERKLLYQVLAQHSIDAVLYNVTSLDDFAVIRYINTTYPLTKVVAASDTSFYAKIDNIRQSDFASLQLPYHLNQLHELITAVSFKPESKQL